MKKFIAGATTTFVAIALTVAGAALPASAEDVSTPSTSTTSSTPSDNPTPESTPPAPTPPTPAPTPPAEAPPTATPPAPTPDVVPAPSCIPTSAVSYTYISASNSGSVVVADVEGSSHVLCDPFWLTATSWKYTNPTQWPQTRDKTDDLGEISTPGTYAFSAPVTCGQGDIYAAYHPLELGDTLTSPGKPFEEHFLMDMGFQALPGNYPTYSWVDPSCWTPQVVTGTATTTQATCAAPQGNLATLPAVEGGSWSWSKDGGAATALPVNTASTFTPSQLAGFGTYTFTLTDADAHDGFSVTRSTTTWTPTDVSQLNCDTIAIPGDPEVTPVVCTSGQAPAGGTITVALNPGLIYSVVDSHNNPVPIPSNGVITGLAAGNYVVSVVAAPGFQLDPATASHWPLTVAVLAGDNCLPTLPSWAAGASPSAAICTDLGPVGTITLEHATNEDGKVDYSIQAAGSSTVTDLGSTSTTIFRAPGTYTITATPTVAGDGIDGGTNVFVVTVDAPPTGVCGDLPTEAGFDANASVAAATCRASDGTSANILLETTPGEVDYSITNLATNVTTDVGTSQSSVPVGAGNYRVTARVVHAGDTLFGQNQSDGSQTFALTVAAIVAACDPLATLALHSLAFTGVSLALPLTVGGGLVSLGALLLFLRRRQARIAE